MVKINMLECVWRVIPSIVIWEVWKERNMRFFQEISEPVEKLLRRIDHSIEEVVSAAVFRKEQRKCGFTKDDRAIQKEWPGIKIRQAGVLSKDKSKEE